MKEVKSLTKKNKIIFKKCHLCGTIMESFHEQKKCKGCKKSFLPSNYFGKVHAKNSKEYDELFSSSDDLQEEDLVKGINVLW